MKFYSLSWREVSSAKYENMSYRQLILQTIHPIVNNINK